MRQLNEHQIEELNQNIAKGYVRESKHPTLPLSIYNYTQKAQFESEWNPTTRMCRGLILDDHYNIIVKCPEKFFNVGEPFAAKIDLTNARISEKLDGYYISIKADPDYGLIVSSRGSFDNRYTHAAESFITDERLLAMGANTYFCELLQNFPGDESIILTKHPTPRLVCWAIKDTNYQEIFPDDECPFERAKELSLAEAKQYLKQKVEGIVAQDTNTFERVKLKTDWFMEHHRLLSDCTKKRVWEILSKGQDLETLDIPDEFMQQMRVWKAELVLEYELFWQKVLQAELETSNLTDKELGLLNDYQTLKPFIFLLRKDRDQECMNKIWDRVKPSNML